MGVKLIQIRKPISTQIGCKFLVELSDQPHLDENGNAIFEDIQGDIRDSALWDRAMEAVDIVFHFAGQTCVYVADKDPVCDYQANVLPMLLMLEACKKNDVHPDILFAGTSTIVGLPEELPVNETFPDQSIGE